MTSDGLPGYPGEPPHISKSFHAHLPAELLSMVLEEVVSLLADPSMLPCEVKRLVSSWSRVSYEWSMRLRPLLFRTLKIYSITDAYDLLALLHSPTSHWLASDIEEITLDSESIDEYLSRPPWRIVLRRLPSLRHLWLSGPQRHLFPFSCEEAISFSGFRSLTSLLVSHWHFPSAMTFLRLLCRMPSLRRLTLYNVEWYVSLGDDALPDCVGGFSEMQEIRTSHTSNVWFVTWIIAARCFRHTFSRKIGPSFSIPEDMHVAVQFIRILHCPAEQLINPDLRVIEHGEGVCNRM